MNKLPHDVSEYLQTFRATHMSLLRGFLANIEEEILDVNTEQFLTNFGDSVFLYPLALPNCELAFTFKDGDICNTLRYYLRGTGEFSDISAFGNALAGPYRGLLPFLEAAFPSTINALA